MPPEPKELPPAAVFICKLARETAAMVRTAAKDGHYSPEDSRWVSALLDGIAKTIERTGRLTDKQKKTVERMRTVADEKIEKARSRDD